MSTTTPLTSWLTQVKMILARVSQAAQTLQDLGPAPMPATPEEIEALLAYRQSLGLPHHARDVDELDDACDTGTRTVRHSLSDARSFLREALTEWERSLLLLARHGTEG